MKSFHAYIERYQFLTPDRIFGDLKRTFEPIVDEDGSTIYFIVKCKKVRWLPERFRSTLNYSLRGRIEIDGVVESAEIDMAAFWYAMPGIQENFPDKSSMASYFLDRQKNALWQLIPKPLRYKLLSRVKPLESTAQVLAVQCGIMRNLNKDGLDTARVFAYQAINQCGLPAPKLEVVYIGSSLVGSFGRLESHEKWGRIFSEKSEDEDILIYFCRITGEEIRETRGPGLSLVSRDSHELDRATETLITEMALISHFKPLYNDHHTRRSITHSKRVQEKLVSSGYSQVDVEVLLDGSMGKLGSRHTGRYGAHTARIAIA